MKATLYPCAACQRHVRYAEAACPFCSAPLSHRQAPALPDVSRLSRTARVALGAMLAAAAVPGCASGTQDTPPPQPPPVAVPAYGAPAPAPDDGGSSTTPGQPVEPAPPDQPPPQTGPGPNDPGAARPLYGVPPPPE